MLADRTAGFCGADLKSLVTESALGALRRRYPQVRNSSIVMVFFINQRKVVPDKLLQKPSHRFLFKISVAVLR